MAETFAEALPPRVAVVSVVSHVMLKPAGIRMRISSAATMEGATALSVTVLMLTGVIGSPKLKD